MLQARAFTADGDAVWAQSFDTIPMLASTTAHAWGLAIDMNSGTNPIRSYSSIDGATACMTPIQTDMPPQHYALCGCEDMPGYPERWGGE